MRFLAAMPVGLVACAIGFGIAPWYAIEDGFFSTLWVPDYPFDPELAPAILQALLYHRPWLGPLVLPLLLPLLVLGRPRGDRLRANVLVAAGCTGLFFALGQGWAIGPLGLTSPLLERFLGQIAGRQYGMGCGAFLVLGGFLALTTEGLAGRGVARSDRFVVGALGFVVALVMLFVIGPLGTVLSSAFETDSGDLSALILWQNLASLRLVRTAAHSLLLACLTGAGTVLFGLALALAVTRTRLRGARILRALSILPIITPPFVVGLALILAFGRAGALTLLLERFLGIPSSRYIFGLPGLVIAQLLAFTPIAFLILSGVVEGISPSLEEAAQTLRASRWRTFCTVTLPLMRPGLASAFLVGFIESLADFGNPLALAGSSFEVLSTEIYFAVAGAETNVPRAAAMALVLLAFTLSAFLLQRWWVGGKRQRYTTVAGKGFAGLPCPLPCALEIGVLAVAVPWAIFTFGIYALVVCGGFVESIGQDSTLTLSHFRDLFAASVRWSEGSLAVRWTGGAWASLRTTVELAAVAAPLTALFGLLVAYLIDRQRFAGRGAFELGTMLAFAVPGTVVGVAYVLAFNAPPFELTGTGAILVLSFVFRNMPVGVRAGLATLAQIDPSLDEASTMLGARTSTTVRRVILPLLRPAIVTSLVYGFVRAVTAVSAVIFLVSADHSLATTYILASVESGDYGRAIAYSSVLVVLMLAVILLVQRLVGRQDLARRVVA
ncbi:MAG: iron ABC transporter permease [Deltaproteobacteria bacterium]|nr:iron ABC transporter permease [Deltaproteobacteria bacterium]